MDSAVKPEHEHRWTYGASFSATGSFFYRTCPCGERANIDPEQFQAAARASEIRSE